MRSTIAATEPPPQGQWPLARGALASRIDYRSFAVFVGFALYVTVMVTAFGAARRDAGSTAVVVEVLVWLAAAIVVGFRDGRLQLRISDPGVLFLAWTAYFFLSPGMDWVTGGIRYIASDDQVVAPRVFVRVQLLQSLFIAGFCVAYRALAPNLRFDIAAGTLAKLPRARWLLLAGIIPNVVEVIRRLLASGSLAPTQTYGEVGEQLHDQVVDAGRAGGGDLFAAQVFAKVWFVPGVLIGVGLGLVFARLIAERRWSRLLAYHAVFPMLLYLSPGARSAVLAVYLVTMALADLLAGPVPWQLVIAVTGVGGIFSQLYQYYRGVQSVGLSQAVALTADSFSRQSYSTGEGAGMLLKEAFLCRWVDRAGTIGPEYFLEQVLGVLPRQLVPEKMSWQRTGDFLSVNLLGKRASEAGQGIAGAMVGDGYWIGRELGVAVLALVLGLLVAAVVRSLVVRRSGSPRMYQVALLACFCSRLFSIIRGDLGIVLTDVLYAVVIPAIFLYMLLLRRPDSVWMRPIPIAQPGGTRSLASPSQSNRDESGTPGADVRQEPAIGQPEGKDGPTS